MNTPKKVRNIVRRMRKLARTELKLLGRFEKEMAREAEVPLEELQKKLDALETADDIELFFQQEL